MENHYDAGKYYAMVFEKDGVEFIIPHPHYSYMGKDEEASRSNILIESMMFATMTGTNKLDFRSWDISEDGVVAMRYQESQLGGPMFAHGSIDICILSGEPEYNEGEE